MQAALFAQGGQLAKQLVAVIVNEPHLRGHVNVGLARACADTLTPRSRLSRTLQESNGSCLRTLSTRVLPEMFKAYAKLYVESKDLDASVAETSRRNALEAVQGIARISEKTFLDAQFKLLVTSLLKLTTEDAVSSTATPEAIKAALEQAAPLGDLANALIPHLPGALLELALKVFTPMLSNSGCASNDSAITITLQKASYRALRAVMQHPESQATVEDLFTFWTKLRESRETCEVAALKSRFAAIEALLKLMWTNLSPQLAQVEVREAFLTCLKTLLPEILGHLRDPGTAVRDSCRESLQMVATMSFDQDLTFQVSFLALLTAGLAALQSLTKSSAIDALSRILYEHGDKMGASICDRLVQVVLPLLQDNDAQIWRSTVKFTKVVVFVLSPERLSSHVPSVMCLFQSKHLVSAKMLVRKIITRLARVLPGDILQEYFPKKHVPLLHYVQRQLARQQRPQVVRESASGGKDEEMGKQDAKMEDATKPNESWASFDGDDRDEVHKASGKKKKRAAKTPGAAEPASAPGMGDETVQALLDAWEAESDGEENPGRKGSKIKRKRDVTETSTWIQEDANAPLDFMSESAARSVLTTRGPQSKRQRGDVVGPSGAENKADALRRVGLCFSEDGRLVVNEEEEEQADADVEQKKLSLNADAIKDKGLSTLAKQREMRAKAKAKAKLARGVHQIKGLDAFKPKKGSQGDNKKKGQKLDPYAYVRLNPKVLKEKFRAKATQSFAAVVDAPKKGALKGAKAKVRELKLRRNLEFKKKLKKTAHKKSRKTNSR